MKRILQLLNTNRFSGAENVVCQIINLFSNDQNYEMAYCSLNGDISVTLERKNIRFIPIERMSVSEVKRVISDYKPDVIHAHDVKASLIASMCHKDIKMICTIHANDLKMRKINLKSLCMLKVAKESNHIFWVSRSCYNGYVFKKNVQQQSSILYNVINPSILMEQVKSDDQKYDFDIVYLGRLSKQKNPYRLAEVISKVCEKKPDVKVAIIGDGELREELENIIATRKISGNVTMFGFMNNPYKILIDSKVMIMTSDWEGTPMCVLEAMCLGVPIVSTPVDGIKDLVQNQINGYLSNEIETLANELVKIITDCSYRKMLSDNTKSLFGKYNSLADYRHQIEMFYM